MIQISQEGPMRVLIDEHESTTPDRALRDYGVSLELIFIRDDCWSLGVPAHLKKAAEKLWDDEWIGVYDPRKRELLTYEEYKQG
jgi:hypothetical protein